MVSPLVRRIVLVALALVAGVAAYALGRALRPGPELQGITLEQPPQLGELELVRGDGTEVRLGELAAGGTTLVFFGFTRCPDVCPLTMARLAAVYQALDRPRGLSVVMVSVDPEHDTPEIVDAYVRGFDPAFVGLTGSSSQVAAAARSFYVGYAGIGGPTFTHTDVVAILDRQGALRYIYSQDALRHLAADLPRIMQQRGF